jgi:hypothetical protein
MSGLIVFIIFSITIARKFNGKYKSIKISDAKFITQSQKIISLSLFLPFLLASIVYSFDFSKWIRIFEIEAKKSSGWAYIEDVRPIYFSDHNEKFSWGWTNPSLSIILRGDASGGILNSKSYTGWQPFDPFSLKETPIGYFYKK